MHFSSQSLNVSLINIFFYFFAKLRIFCETLAIRRLQKYLAVVDAEDAAVADAAALAGGKQFYVASAAIKIVAERDTIL